MPKGWRLSIEVTKNQSASEFYCTDARKREAGPWTDKDVVRWLPPDAVLASLLPWQEEAINHLKTQRKREILFVHDSGGTGKSALLDHLEATQDGVYVPALLPSGQAIMRWCAATYKEASNEQRGKQRLFMMDIPKAEGTTPQKWGEVLAALETIKGGRAFDDRYTKRDERFATPKIIVFCNRLPPAHLLTDDRWVVLSPPPLPPHLLPSEGDEESEAPSSPLGSPTSWIVEDHTSEEDVDDRGLE
jgi:hypothetical protein